MSSNRRTFYFDTPRAPQETSEFAGLPRDLAHLVLVHLSMPFLCLLKSTSRRVANACRHALCSNELLESYENWQMMHSAVSGCNLSFPIKVCLHQCYSTRKFGYNSSIYLIVHEFELEFYLYRKRVRDMDVVKEWLEKSMQYMEEHNFKRDPNFHRMCNQKKNYMRSMDVDCIRFCVELPGEGIFHSAAPLWSRLSNVQDADAGIKGFGGILQGFRHGDRGTQVLDLATWLWPYAMIGGKYFTFDFNALDYDALDHDGFPQCSLLHCILEERLCYQRYAGEK